MKRRIEEIKDSRGLSRYYPQWKFIWWHYYDDGYDGAVYFPALDEALNWINYELSHEVKYHPID